jgi:hypothetical protein
LYLKNRNKSYKNIERGESDAAVNSDL